MAVRGRPRGFDRDAALAKAMQLFWAKGYEGVQLAELTAAVGINPPSFYAAVQSKEAIHREALDLYPATAGDGSMAALRDTPGTTTDAVHAMLLASVEVALASPSAGGCMDSLGLVNGQDQNAALRDDLRALRRTTATLIRDRLERGVREADLPADIDAERVATFCATVMQGLSLQAQDGASRDMLIGVVETAMTALDI
ncbi:TetR/AcrR family transcriptional regulator [Corticibacterium sp. UT-5YL-CI-8]|nr:TetR/AcrR family transcriptional regulator [Tianweitania sp. UT-5YL-CI-8]